MSQKRRTRRRFSPEQKVAILKRHFVEKVPVSELCKTEKISPKQFYDWQKVLFEGASSAFEKETTRQVKTLEDERQRLESKIRKKNDVIAQLMEEHIALKKNHGDL